MSWKKTSLGELVKNFSIRAKDYSGSENFEFFGVSNENGIIKTKYAVEDKLEDYKVMEKGCFAYNPYRINVGSIALLKEENHGLISPAYIVFKTIPNSIIPELLLKYLKSSEGLRQIRFHARGTVRQALRFEDLCKIEISIPDYKEQEIFFKKIKLIEIKDELLCCELTHQLNLVTQLRQSYLREAMKGKLVPQDQKDEPANELLKRIKKEKEKLIKEKKLKKEKELPPIKPEEIPFKIPKNWVWCRLGEIAYVASGSTPNKDAFISNGVPFLKMFNLRNQKIDFDYRTQYIKDEVHIGLLNRSRTQVGDVLMNIVGPPLGKLAIIPDTLPQSNINQALVLIRTYYKTEINKWIFWYLNEMSEINSIITKGVAGQDNISVNQSRTIKIPLPPFKEQQEIIIKLEKLMTFCDNLEHIIKTSKEQAEMLLQQVLREALRGEN
jgi:type I restriction enzyme S subunit